MPNPFLNSHLEKPNVNIGSSLASASGHGLEREKRKPVAEYLGKLKGILRSLPEESRDRLVQQLERIKKDPHTMIEIIKQEIAAQHAMVDFLNEGVPTNEALAELERLIPSNPNRVQ